MMARASHLQDDKYLADLDYELARAKVVTSRGIPAHVITMNSKVRMLDTNTQEEMVYWLVYPDYANDEHGKISILSQMGTALIGYEAGDIIEGNAAIGLPTLKVEEILYQPEASGDFHL